MLCLLKTLRLLTQRMMAKERTHPTAPGMLPPKIVHKNHRPSVPQSADCPIDKLPAEIIHMICVYLRPTELANLRLVSRLVGPISLHYMVPEVHLVLTKDSFERLKAIAAHPIASKYVTSFFFEADRFSEWSRGRWEYFLVSPGYVAQLEELGMQGRSCQYASDESLWISGHGFSKLESTPCHHYTEKEIERAYEKYVELLRLQQMHPDVTDVAEAMKHFPHLNELKMTISDCGQMQTSRLRKLFQPALTGSYETSATPSTRLEPLGLQQMRSLLLGAYSAGLKVETLQCGLVDWRTLDQSEWTFARMRDSVSNVRNLRLDFDTGGDVDYGSPWWSPSCPQVFGRRLGDFVAAASKLEHLQISFQSDYPDWPAGLENIVGEHHWPSLKSINLKVMGTAEDELVSFCSRHASTLKSVHLTSIGISEGNWYAALDRMRKILTLDSIVLEGILESRHDQSSLQEYHEGYYGQCERTLEKWFLRACPGAERELGDFMEEFMESYERELDANDLMG